MTLLTRATVPLTFGLLLVVLSGCNSTLGEWVVKSPNHGMSLAAVSLDEPLALENTVIDHRFRVEIADPAASLLVWVVDPSGERFVGTEPLVNPEDDEEAVVPIFEPTEGNAHTTPGPPRGTILLLHGYYDTVNEARYLMWARIFASHGYRAVLVDQRGHGRSTGEWATYGVAESNDMVVVLDSLEQKNLLVEPVGVMAVSFGASTAMRLAEIDKRVRAMVLVSTFTSMRDVVPDFGRAIGFTFFSDEKYQGIIDAAGKHGGFDPDQATVIDRITRIDTPILLIHGEDDNLIPIQHAVRVYQAADRDTVELVRVAHANHTSLGDQIVEPIRQPMLDWFERYLPDTTPVQPRPQRRQAHGQR